MFSEKVIGGSRALLEPEAMGNTLSPLASLGKCDAAVRLFEVSGLFRSRSTIDAGRAKGDTCIIAREPEFASKYIVIGVTQ